MNGGDVRSRLIGYTLFALFDVRRPMRMQLHRLELDALYRRDTYDDYRR